MDGRAFPWGHHARAVDVAALLGAAAEPSRRATSSSPDDVSVYGARGLGGNVSAWCLGEPGLGVHPVRGGNFLDGPEGLRCAHIRSRPDAPMAWVGFRLAVWL